MKGKDLVNLQPNLKDYEQVKGDLVIQAILQSEGGIIMRVSKLMTTEVKTCRAGETLEQAARLMWENDFGCVPVVDDANKVVGILTDRDICMAAYTQGLALREIPLSSVMSRQLYSCHPEDSLQVAQEIMKEHQVRRLPVVDGNGTLKGILSLNDLILEAGSERHKAGKQVTDDEVARTLEAIAGRHLPQVVA